MRFESLPEMLLNRLTRPLPGSEAHLELTSMKRFRSFPIRPAPDTKKSGVLVLLYPDNHDIKTIFIQRPDYDGVHGGQVSFPGGKWERHDPDLVHTALRESQEEIGIRATHVRVLGTLTELFIPPSNFLVTPVVGWTDPITPLLPDPEEVVEILHISVYELIKPSTLQTKRVTAGDWQGEVPCFFVHDKIIWGATAMILNEMLDVIKPFLPPLS